MAESPAIVDQCGWVDWIQHEMCVLREHEQQRPTRLLQRNCDWTSTESVPQFVREPFLSRHSEATIVAGTILPNAPLALESQMPTGGVIFSDGVEADHLDFNSGAIANIQIAPEKANLVVN